MRKRVAFITGGATGLGRITALRLAADGYQVVVNYRNSETEAAALIDILNNRFGSEHLAVKGDVANYQNCEAMVKQIVTMYAGVDVLVHNAGPYIAERKKLTQYRPEEWNYLLQGNLSAAFYLAKLLIPYMRKQRWGRMITLGFDRVETAPGWIYRSAFAAAKTGLASLTRSIALEEAEYGITANMVSPGDIRHDWKEKSIHEAILETDDEWETREGTGEDIARVIAFLAHEKSDYITGSVIPVTGGIDVLGKVYRESY